MIDLQNVEPLVPKHFRYDPETNHIDLSCTEMAKLSETDSKDPYAYRCTDAHCKLTYNKFAFAGYYRDPSLPKPERDYPDNVLPKMRVCQPRCAVLKLDPGGEFYSCTACYGIYIKNPNFSVTEQPRDWLMQDKAVLKYLLLWAMSSAVELRTHLRSLGRQLTLEESWQKKQLEKSEKEFMSEILVHCLIDQKCVDDPQRYILKNRFKEGQEEEE
ncbi:hypothetical protein KGO95_03820 [Patescibacteria group bacterium]|nr:hypothetical protein [Patescibacteria group bacterium]